MKFGKFRWSWLLSMTMLVGCAGMSRECSSWGAGTFGSNWVIVQYANDGRLIKCWRLSSVSVSNEEHSDGIYWKSPDGHLVHISGWYNRVQVDGGDWAGAAKELDINLEGCG